MRTAILFFVALVSALGVTAQDTAENPKNLIKLNFDGLFDARYQVGIERIVGKYTSVQLNAGLLFDYEISESTSSNTTTDNRMSGFVLTPEFRVYLSEFTKNETPKGFFIGFFGRVRDFTSSNYYSDGWVEDDSFTDVTTVGAGLHVGFQYFTSFGLGFDAWVGPEFRYRTEDSSTEIIYSDPFLNDISSSSSSRLFETVGFAGVGIVYAF